MKEKTIVGLAVLHLALIVIPVQAVGPFYDISGNVFYNGTKTGIIYIMVFTEDLLEGSIASTSITQPGGYTITLEPGSYYIAAFMDTNGNEYPDFGEPTGFAVNKTLAIDADLIEVNYHVSNVNITLQDSYSIDKCTDIIFPGYYELKNDLEGNLSSGHCLGIFTRDLILEGGDHSIKGDLSQDTIGIYIYNTNNVTVNKVNVSNYSEGIRIYYSSKCTVNNSKILNNNNSGILALGSKENKIENNEIKDNNLASDWRYGGLVLYQSNDTTINRNNVTGNRIFGIHLESSSNNRVINNNISYNGGGVAIVSGGNNYVANNNVSNEIGLGIYIGSSNSNTITNNNVSNGGEYGIWLYNSAGNIIDMNNISNNKKSGIEAVESNNNRIVNNNITNNSFGVAIHDSSKNGILKNNIQNNYYSAILIDAYSIENRIENNEIRDNNLAEIGDYGGIVIKQSKNNSIINNKVTGNKIFGVRLESSQNNTFYGNEIVDNCGGQAGVYIYQAENIAFDNNNVSQNTGYGFLIESSTNITIYRNKILGNNYDGIDLEDDSYLVKIVENTISNNRQRGVYIYSSSNNYIYGNTIAQNGDGILLSSSNSNEIIANKIYENLAWDSGINLLESNFNKIQDNRIWNNSVGLVLWSSNENTIVDNKIYQNKEYGFYIGNSNDNLIYNNLFNNTNNVAISGGSNTWNNTTLQKGTNIIGGNWLGGNAWLSPDGTGYSQTCIDTEEPIGICDESYELYENNVDNLPIKASPDIFVTSLAISPGQPVAGREATINATVSNRGYSNVEAFNVSFFANEELIKDVRVNGLNIGSSTILSVVWTPVEAKEYRIRVIADSNKEIAEIDEDNNENSMMVSVKALPTPRPLAGGVGGPGTGAGAIPGVPIYITGYIIVKENEESTIELPQSAFWETNVLALVILSSEDNNIRFRIEKLTDLPPGIPEPKGDLLVLILSIEPTLSKESSLRGKLKFGIPIEEIKAKGFDPNLVSVVLLKWNGKEWIELPTKFLNSDGKYNYYEAETPSFSYFVAQLKPFATPPPTSVITTPPTTTPPLTTIAPTTPSPGFIPGFEAIFAIAGLIAVSYLVRRKN